MEEDFCSLNYIEIVSLDGFSSTDFSGPVQALSVKVSCIISIPQCVG